MKTSQRASANIKSLHEKALETARNYIRLEKELLEIIIEIEKKKAYRRLGYSSLYTYVNEGLKISPSTSYNFIQVARKSIEVPALKEEVSSGRTLYQQSQKNSSGFKQRKSSTMVYSCPLIDTSKTGTRSRTGEPHTSCPRKS